MESTTNNSGIVLKFSEVLTNSLKTMYNTGKFGLVFIFVGLLFILLAQLPFSTPLLSPMFWIGAVLIITSFLLFLYQQLSNPILKERRLDKDKEMYDYFQKTSIVLISVSQKTQTLLLKHLSEIHQVVSSGIPFLENLPFVSDTVKKSGLKLNDINNRIVEFTNESEILINEVLTALKNADLKKLKTYVKKLEQLNETIISYLKI